jgi:hypothetical protein
MDADHADHGRRTMTARKQERPLGAQLAAMREAIVTAKQRARDCELAHRRADGDVARLRDAVIDAHADGDEARARKAGTERDKAERTTLRDAAERLEGARRAVVKAEADLGLFAREHADALLAEQRPAAVAAAQGVEDAVEQLGEAHARWQAVAADVVGLLRLAGRNTSLPAFPERLADLVRDARRSDGVLVPPPVPHRHAATPTPMAASQAA